MKISHIPEEIIKDYLNYYRTKNKKYWWAYEAVEEISQSPDSLDFVFNLIQACQNDYELAYVAAGPLEDLLKRFAEIIKDKLNVMVRQHKSMRKAIQFVILSKDSIEKKILTEILQRYGLEIINLKKIKGKI